MAQPALDEVYWRADGAVEYFYNAFGGDPIWVYHYFRESPFFSAASNNGILLNQALVNENMRHLAFNRLQFEDRLRSMQGLEFMVVDEPQQTAQGDSGVWIIRKQNRERLRSNGVDETRVTVLGTYYVVGESIYQAPSVEDVIGSRILSATIALDKFFSTATTLPTFTPAQGYSYLPPQPKTTLTSNAISQTIASAQESRSNTPMPDSLPSVSSQLQPQAPKPTSASTSIQASRTLAESYGLALRYGSEYMDEAPLIGEPGSFVISSAHDRRQEQAKPAAANAKPQDATGGTGPAAPTARPPNPFMGGPIVLWGKVKKPVKAEKESAEGTGADGVVPPKPRRRKSKAPTNPTSPASGTPV